MAAKAELLRGPRAGLQTLRAQNLPNPEPAEESCKETTEVLQVFMTKPIFHLGFKHLKYMQKMTYHVTDAIRAWLTFIICFGPSIPLSELLILFRVAGRWSRSWHWASPSITLFEKSVFKSFVEVEGFPNYMIATLFRIIPNTNEIVFLFVIARPLKKVCLQVE